MKLRSKIVISRRNARKLINDNYFPLGKDDIVHHVDGNPLNNDPENLVVVNFKEHMDIHKRLGIKVETLIDKFKKLESLVIDYNYYHSDPSF